MRLGRLPRVGVARVTIVLPEPLKEELDLYSAEHSRLYEPVETAALIPHMLEAFLRSDRGWRSRKAKLAGARQRPKTPLTGGVIRNDSDDGDPG
nr:DUF2274 domain-containing protein [Acidomonas methanolica]